MRGLYAIVDTQACAERGFAPLELAAGLLRSRPAALQLRAKGLPARETLALLKALRAITPPEVWLFGNDRPDLALLAGCDGVHLGQSDLPLESARSFAPMLRVGVSTHDLSQLGTALRAKPDYVAFGPVFGTESKRLLEPLVGLELLGAAHAECVQARIPLVAIGGIDLSRASAVARRSDCVAAIGALMPPRCAAGTPPQAQAATVAENACTCALAFTEELRRA